MKYVDKIYGEFELTEVLEALIKTKTFQRLSRIHQGGPIFLVNPALNHTRFEHSVGVMFLIKKLGGSIEEQIAGLLHDISHTAFSHLIDFVLEVEEEDYHEKRYEKVLKSSDIPSTLLQYGFKVEAFTDLDKFPILEYPLPALSTDRIDYTLRDLFQLGKISLEEINWFLEGMLVFQGRVVLKAVEYAAWFQEAYTYLTQHYFEGEENMVANSKMKALILECLDRRIITIEDFFQDDFYLLEKINREIEVKARLQESGIATGGYRTKKRKVDPEVLLNGEVRSLSEIRDYPAHPFTEKNI
ncbi:MAG: HD domain-containing protein [Bacteroidota bacterium]